jgi:hypothetical protein
MISRRKGVVRSKEMRSKEEAESSKDENLRWLKEHCDWEPIGCEW